MLNAAVVAILAGALLVCGALHILTLLGGLCLTLLRHMGEQVRTLGQTVDDGITECRGWSKHFRLPRKAAENEAHPETSRLLNNEGNTP